MKENCIHDKNIVVNRGPYDRETLWCLECGSMKFMYATEWVVPGSDKALSKLKK